MKKKTINFYFLAANFILLLYITLIFSLAARANTKTADYSVKIIPTPTIMEYIVISETPIPTATPRPTLTPTPTPKPVIVTDIDKIIEKYANNHSVSYELLKKIARCESGFNTNARNG